MKLREVKTAADELVAIPRQLNMVLAAMFVSLLVTTAALIVIALKEK